MACLFHVPLQIYFWEVTREAENFNSKYLNSAFITPRAQRERGKVIDRGVHIYIYIYMSVVEKKI